MNQLRVRWRYFVKVVRAMPVSQLALRAALAATAVAAFTMLPDRGATLAGIAGWVALLAAPFAVVLPGSDAPVTVLGGIAVSWVVGYGGHVPPVADTVVLGALLYLHHVVAALAGSTPPTAFLDPALARRWSAPLLAGLAGLALGAAAAYGTHQLPLSPVLQIAGLVGVLVTAGVLVVLTRR